MTPDTIELFWQGSNFIALSWLIKESFQLDDTGLIHLAGLDNDAIDLSQKIHIHEGMCAVFLRHNQFYQTGKLVNAELTVEEKSGVSIQIPNLVCTSNLGREVMRDSYPTTYTGLYSNNQLVVFRRNRPPCQNAKCYKTGRET